jgi:inner membrane transporter RhtA
MIVGTSITIQLSGTLAYGLFDQLGATGVSAMRFALASVFLLVGVRPSLRGRTRATWRAIVLYGLSLAALNIGFFQAIDRIPLGIAVTLAFAGPVVMSIVASRRASDVAWALLAGAGVAVLGGLDRPDSVVGVVFGLATGAAWVGVAYAGRAIGQRTERIDGLALAVPVAAMITVPLGAPHLGDVDAHALGIGVVIAVVGLILPFALEIEGLRRLEPRVVAVLYSIDPAVAAIAGLVFLGQRLTVGQWLAMGAVMVASVAAVGRGQAPSDH